MYVVGMCVEFNHTSLFFLRSKRKDGNDRGWREQANGPANKVPGIIDRYYVFVDVTKTTLNFGIAFREEYNEKYDVTRIINILKDIMVSDIPTGVVF